jgi:uncharacterized membrane protein YhaH (DUF805 family)
MWVPVFRFPVSLNRSWLETIEIVRRSISVVADAPSYVDFASRYHCIAFLNCRSFVFSLRQNRDANLLIIMENKPVVTVCVQQTHADFIDLWRATRFKYLIWILYLIGLFYLYWAFAIFFNGGYTMETSSSILQFSFVALFAFFVALIVPRLRARMSLGGPVAREQRNISVSPQGVSVESSVFSATYNWTAFTLIKETKDSLLLFTAPIVALILPKRAFSSPDELQQFRSLIRGYFPGRKTLRD